MAEDKQTPEVPTPAAPAPQLNMADFASMIGAAVSKSVAEANPKKETFGHYTKRINAGRSKLTRECFQNGFRLENENLSNKAIDLLNTISHTGRYINRLVEVIVRDEGAEEAVEIRYNNKTADQRAEIRGHIRSTEEMLQMIVDAQVIEKAEYAAQGEKKTARRHFGDTKGYREAKERAEV